MNNISISVVENEEGFCNLEKDWNKLAAGLIQVNSFDWHYKWWKTYKEKNKLQILVARKNDKVVGIAPLYMHFINEYKLLNFKKLAFLGGDVSDFLDFLIDQGPDKELVFKHLLDYALENISCDYIGFGPINSDYPNFHLWNHYSKKLELEFESYRECAKCRLFEFKSYDEYYEKLNKNLKRSIKYRLNKVKKDNVQVEYVFKTNITEEDIKKIADVNIKRQNFLKEKGKNDRFCYFTDEKKNIFIKDNFCNKNDGTKMLAYITCNGHIASYFLIMLSNNVISCWNTGFDNEFEDYCPSKLLINEIIKYGFENGYEYFDFMRGNDPYKFQWTNRSSFNYNLRKKKSLKTKISSILKTLIIDSVIKEVSNLRTYFKNLDNRCSENRD